MKNINWNFIAKKLEQKFFRFAKEQFIFLVVFSYGAAFGVTTRNGQLNQEQFLVGFTGIWFVVWLLSELLEPIFISDDDDDDQE